MANPKSLPAPFLPPPNLKLFLSYASKGTDPWEKEGTAHCQERWRDLWIKPGEKYFSLEIWVLYSEGGGFQTQKDLVSSNRRDNIRGDSMKKSTTSFSKVPLKPFSAVGWTLSGGVFPNDDLLWLCIKCCNTFFLKYEHQTTNLTINWGQGMVWLMLTKYWDFNPCSAYKTELSLKAKHSIQSLWLVAFGSKF